MNLRAIPPFLNKPIIQSSIWILISREFALSIVNVIFSLYILSVVQEGNLGLGLAYLASGLGQIIGGITLAKYFKKRELTVNFYKTMVNNFTNFIRVNA